MTTRDRRVDDVRRVEPAAEPDLEHRDVDASRRRSTSIAIAVICSKNVSSSPPAAAHALGRRDDRGLADRARRRSRSARAASTGAATCTSRRACPPRAASAAIIATVEPLPFVPATWTTVPSRRSGAPSAIEQLAHPLEAELHAEPPRARRAARAARRTSSTTQSVAGSSDVVADRARCGARARDRARTSAACARASP